MASSMVWAGTQPEELFTAATQAYHNGFAEVAIRYCEDFITQFPDNLKVDEVKFLLGQSYFLKNRYKDAYNIFFLLSQGTTNLDGVGFWLGETYLKLGNTQEASLSYRRVIQEFPQSPFAPQAMYSMGWMYLENKDYVKARETFTELVHRFPINALAEDAWLKASEAALNANDWNAAIDLLKDYAKQYPTSSHLTEVLFNLGECYYNLNNFSLAFENYQKTIQAEQSNPSIKLSSYIGSLWSLVKLGKLQEAKDLTRVVKDFVKSSRLPDDEFLLALGNIFLEIGDYDNALDTFNTLLAQHPSDDILDQVYLGRANVYFASKNYALAKDDYLKILTSSDGDVNQKAHFGLGWLMLKEANPKQAMVYFQAVVDKADDPMIKASAYTQMADAYQDSGQYEAAIDVYQRLMAEGFSITNKDYVLYRLGMAYLKLDRPDEALKNLDALRKNFPQSAYLADGDYYVGVAAFKKGDWVQSSRSMDSFIKGLTKPSEFTPQANYILAISKLNLKQPEESLKIFQKILRLYPDNQVVAKNADVGIARCYVDLDQEKEAQKRFKLIVFKYPKSDASFEALTWLAKNELKNNNPQEAVRFYLKAIDEFPTSLSIETIYYELAQAYELMADSDNALVYYKKITGDNELAVKAKFAMAELMSKDVNIYQAIDIYTSMMKTYPDYARLVAVKLGQLYRSTQQYEKELDVYTAALKVSEGKSGISTAQLQFNLSDTLELMSRTDEAVEHYLTIGQQAGQELTWTVKAYLRVAKIYEDGQDWQAARLTYQKIVSLNTEESKYAQERLDWIKSNVSRKR